MVAKLVPSLSGLLILFITLMTVSLFFFVRIAREFGTKDMLLLVMPLFVFIATGIRFFYYLDWFVSTLFDCDSVLQDEC